MAEHETGEYWRQGNHVARNLYRHVPGGDDRGTYIGVLDSPEFAALACEAVNALLAARAATPETTMRPEDVPDELVDLAYKAIRFSGEMDIESALPDGLAAVLPAHRAMVLESVACQPPGVVVLTEEDLAARDAEIEQRVRAKVFEETDAELVRQCAAVADSEPATLAASDRISAIERGLIEREVRAQVCEELREQAAECRARAEEWTEGSPTPGTLLARAAELDLAVTRIRRRAARGEQP